MVESSVGGRGLTPECLVVLEIACSVEGVPASANKCPGRLDMAGNAADPRRRANGFILSQPRQ